MQQKTKFVVLWLDEKNPGRTDLPGFFVYLYIGTIYLGETLQ
jgi:hypothetical protein